MAKQTKTTTKTNGNAGHRLESLETRQLLSAAYPTALEQYVVELINRARANPAAEAARYGIDLNEGLKAGTISSAAKQPLALNPYLTDAARLHSQWMIDTDTFSHTGANGSTPGDRMKAAGYPFISPWAWSSNIALRSFKTAAPHNDVFDAIQRDLFVDVAISDRGHRVNMLGANMTEVGVGGVYGQYSPWTAEALTENFATSANNHFLTGVVYTDALTKDGFYTPGEGLGGVTLTAVRAGDGATFTTQTWSAGGYSLKLDPGTYKVTASGSSLKAAITYGSVTVGNENVKRDFVPSASTPSTPTPPPTPTPPTPVPPASGAPAAPTGLTATAVSSKSVLLQWADNASNETQYKVERSTDGKTFYPLLGGGVNSMRGLDTGASAGKKYYYRVYATNASGKSAFSNVATVGSGTTPTPDPTPDPTPNPTPDPVPVGAPAAPTNLAVHKSTSVANALELTWTDNSNNEIQFQIERSTDGKNFYRLQAARGTFSRDINLTPGKRYYYRVYATNAKGNSSFTAVVSVVL